MPFDIEEYQRLKTTVEKQKEKRAQAQGALKEATSRLLKESGCKTVEEAQKLLEKLKKEQKADEAEAEKQLTAINKKWSHLWEEGE